VLEPTPQSPLRPTAGILGRLKQVALTTADGEQLVRAFARVRSLLSEEVAQLAVRYA
jgi:hypothetical protein